MGRQRPGGRGGSGGLGGPGVVRAGLPGLQAGRAGRRPGGRARPAGRGPGGVRRRDAAPALCPGARPGRNHRPPAAAPGRPPAVGAGRDGGPHAPRRAAVSSRPRHRRPGRDAGLGGGGGRPGRGDLRVDPHGPRRRPGRGGHGVEHERRAALPRARPPADGRLGRRRRLPAPGGGQQRLGPPRERAHRLGGGRRLRLRGGATLRPPHARR